MNGPSSIEPVQRAKALLAPAALRLDLIAQQAAQAVAAAGLGVSASQVRGLANALAAGPQRRTLASRRMALARYLVWRARRAKPGDAWERLAPVLLEQIAELEARCRSEADQVRRRDQGYWEAHGQALAEEQAELEQRVLETFVHTLARIATQAQATEVSR